MKEFRWPGDITVTVQVPDRVIWESDKKKEYRLTRVTFNLRYKGR